VPITQSALKALRQDRKRTLVNRPAKSRALAAVSNARKNPTQELLRLAYSALDKGVKKHVLKKRKADRLKSRLAALLTKGATPQPVSGKKVRSKAPKKKPAVKKASPKKKA
jgi:ribosomal protein S20